MYVNPLQMVLKICYWFVCMYYFRLNIISSNCSPPFIVKIQSMKYKNNNLSTVSKIRIAKYEFKAEQTRTSENIEVGSDAKEV